MAPEARIISLKVLQADGSGRTSDVIAALDWVRQNRDRFNIRIVNLSLGHPVFESYEDDPLAQAAQTCRRGPVPRRHGTGACAPSSAPAQYSHA